MRSYLLDEISPADIRKIHSFLKKNAVSSRLDQIFLVGIPPDLLNSTQLEHTDCRPHFFSVELGNDWVRLELFVRGQKKINCACHGYCTAQQRDYVFNFAHQMIKRLGITT